MAKITKISVLEAQAYVHKLVSSDVTKESIFTQNTISTIHLLVLRPAFILVPCFQCHVLRVLYSFLFYITCMNNELAKYLCTFIIG